MQLKCVNLLQESRNTTFIAIHNKDAFLSYLELLKPKIIVSLPKNVHVPHCDLVLEFHRFTYMYSKVFDLYLTNSSAVFSPIIVCSWLIFWNSKAFLGQLLLFFALSYVSSFLLRVWWRKITTVSNDPASFKKWA